MVSVKSKNTKKYYKYKLPDNMENIPYERNEKIQRIIYFHTFVPHFSVSVFSFYDFYYS